MNRPPAYPVNEEISAGLTFALKEERHWYLRGIAWGCATLFAAGLATALWAWYDHRLSLLNAAGAGGSPEARRMVVRSALAMLGGGFLTILCGLGFLASWFRWLRAIRGRDRVRVSQQNR